MNFGSPEYRQRFEEKNEAIKPRYVSQIRDIQSVLERGTRIIKHGHMVKGLNPDAICVEVPLNERQRARLKWNLRVLIFRLTEGHAGALGYCLPNHLNKDNPQIANPLPSWKYTKD